MKNVRSNFGVAITEFEITIPIDYNHEKQITRFFERIKKRKIQSSEAIDSVNLDGINENTNTVIMTDANYNKATNRIKPGKTYRVEIIPILSEREITGEECLSFLHEQNCILVGAQGATIVYELGKRKLPKGKCIASFDEKDALWKNSNNRHKVPFIPKCYRSRDDSTKRVLCFTVGTFEGHFGSIDNDCLLCVYEK